jgi:hypothetical protein
MTEVKEMPYSEKYTLTQDNISLYRDFVPLFVRQELDEQAEMDLLTLWQKGIAPITEDASFQKKYELAYENMIWMAKSNFQFIKQRLGESGMERFIQAEINALKAKNNSLAVWMLGLLRAIAPGYAFETTMNQFNYQLQWLTPFTVLEQSRQKSIAEIPRCKILDYEDTEDICLIGCQQIYPRWVAEQFKVDLRFERQDHRCTCTMMPIH